MIDTFEPPGGGHGDGNDDGNPRPGFTLEYQEAERFTAELHKFVDDKIPEMCKTPPVTVEVFSMGKVRRHFRAPAGFQLDKFAEFVHPDRTRLNTTADKTSVGVTVITKKGVCITYRATYDKRKT